MNEATRGISDQRLRSTFFRSITLLTSSAGIILCGSEGLLFPSALTPAFAVLGWILVDHLRWLRVPTLVGNTLGLIALGAVTNEFIGGTLEQKLLSGAHLIVYMTWIVLLMPKGHRQFWWLIALSLLQLAISGVLSTGAGFGAAMLSIMLLLLWTMSVFSLYRVQDQHANRRSDAMTGRKGILVRNGLQQNPTEVWVGWRFRWMVLGSYVVSLVLALFVFAAFPRVWVPGGNLFGTAESASAGLRSRSGFSENVELGRVGQLMLSNERVLTFSATDLRTGKPVTAEAFAEAMNMDEIRFRGNSLAHYSRGQWMRESNKDEPLRRDQRFQRSTGASESGESGAVSDPFDDPGSVSFGKPPQRLAEFRVEIVHDPPIGDFAFAPYPLTNAYGSEPFRIRYRPYSGALIWGGARDAERPMPRTLIVECARLDSTTAADSESRSTPKNTSKELIARISGVTPDGVPRGNIARHVRQRLPLLYQAAQELCTTDGQLVDEPQRVDRILKYLSNDNGFAYSLKQTRQDRSLDPVEDFLLNSKSGHCEYFASACALMLQAVEVRARLVNGYYGTEINALTGKYEVRQRHAHAWVEALIDHGWRTLEPTPSSERRDGVTSNRPVSLMSDIQTAISDFWNDGIHRMSAERQQQFFAPVIATSKNLYQTIRQHGLWSTIKTFFKRFITSPESWVSWQGGVVTFVLLFVVAALRRFSVFQRLLAVLRSFRHTFSEQHRTAQSVIRFYVRFCSLCERHGLTVPPANSALENGRAAVRTFGDRLESSELKDLPLRIARAFNEVRFGSVTLSEDYAAGIGRDLQQLAEALRSPGSLV